MSAHDLNILGAILGVSLARAWWAYSARQAAARALRPPGPVGPGGWVDPRARRNAPDRGRG